MSAVGMEIGFRFRNREARRRARWFAAFCLLAVASVLFAQAFEMLRRDRADQALLAAVRAGNIRAADAALHGGADPNVRGVRFRVSGERSSLWQRLSALLPRSRSETPSANDLKNPTALMMAAASGNLQLVHLLIERGADVNARKRDGSSALIYAVWHSSPKMIRSLLDQGADPNARLVDGRSALVIAAEQDRLPVLTLLLAKGARARTTDAQGETPLILAAVRCQQTEILDLLIRSGCGVNATDRLGNTALLMAAQHRTSNCVKLLLDRGADVNARNQFGQTALTLAAKNGCWENVRLLAAHGADVNARDADGRTALMQLVVEAPMADMIPDAYQNEAFEAFKHGHEMSPLFENRYSLPNCLEGVRTLAAVGVDVNARDQVEETALRDAVQFHKREELIAALKQVGGRF